jgi:hypothetical protein
MRGLCIGSKASISDRCTPAPAAAAAPGGWRGRGGAGRASCLLWLCRPAAVPGARLAFTVANRGCRSREANKDAWDRYPLLLRLHCRSLRWRQQPQRQQPCWQQPSSRRRRCHSRDCPQHRWQARQPHRQRQQQQQQQQQQLWRCRQQQLRGAPSRECRLLGSCRPALQRLLPTGAALLVLGTTSRPSDGCAAG